MALHISRAVFTQGTLLVCARNDRAKGQEMNPAMMLLWRRKLKWRQARLKAAIKRGDSKNASKWRVLIIEANSKLGLPWMKPAKGIDVSSYNGDIDWSLVKKSGISFVYVKVSEGTDWHDPLWGPNRVKAIRAAGLKLGVYHFLRPKHGRHGGEEMRYFIKQAKAAGWGLKGDLRCVIDAETSVLSPSETHAYLVEAITEAKHLTGAPPTVYTGGPWWSENGGGAANYGTRLWLAAYVSEKSLAQYIPTAWLKQGWDVWQYSDKGQVPGVHGAVDVSVAKRLPLI